ncbi:hypothetical protein OROMI_004230 [Orobanche minor]
MDLYPYYFPSSSQTSRPLETFFPPHRLLPSPSATSEFAATVTICRVRHPIPPPPHLSPPLPSPSADSVTGRNPPLPSPSADSVTGRNPPLPTLPLLTLCRVRLCLRLSKHEHSKHLETAKISLFGMSIDFVNLRKEEYPENTPKIQANMSIPEQTFGTAEEDAYRRDLTINSLFYNIVTGAVEDWTKRGHSGFYCLNKMSDNGSVPSPPMKDSDHLFGPSEIGPKFAYEAGIRRKIISDNDVFPEWAGYIRRLRACELEEGGSLRNHILEMMNYMNRLEYLDTNFDRNLAVPLLLRSLPDSYNDFLWKNHCENKSKTWIEIINELRRYEEDKITQKGKLEEEKGKEKRKEKHYALDAQEGSSKRRKSCSWRDLGNGERKCPKNIEESIGSSS